MRLRRRDNEAAFVEAVRKDLARPQLETIIAEVNYVKSEINEALNHLDKWAKPISVKTEGVWKLTKAKMYTEPKGESRINSGSIRFSRAPVLSSTRLSEY